MADRYEQFFLEADTDKSGFLTISELVLMLRKKGYSGTDSQIKSIFNRADDSGDGKISFDEYMAVMSQQPEKNHKEAAMRGVFRSFDKDNSGSIDRAELSEVFKEMGKILPEDQVARIIELADKDGSQTLNYEEFVKQVFG